MVSVEELAPEVAAAWCEAESVLDGHIKDYFPAGHCTNENGSVLVVHGADMRKRVDEQYGERATQYVVKVPSNITIASSIASRMLAREVHVAALLEGCYLDQSRPATGNEPQIELPRVLGFGEDDTGQTVSRYKWAAFSFVPGATLSQTEIRSRLSEDQLYAYGQHVGRLIVGFSRLVSVDTFNCELSYADPHPRLLPGDKLRQLGSIIYTDQLFNRHYRQLAEQVFCLKLLASELEDEITKYPVVGHTDLHSGNQRITLDTQGDPQCVAAIDLDRVRASSFEAEVRFLAQLHEQALAGGVETIQCMTDTKLDNTLIDFWWQVQTLMDCVLPLKDGYPISTATINNLANCFPDQDWQAEFGDGDVGDKAA